MRVLFENSCGQIRELGVTNSGKMANEIIYDFLQQHNYRPFYWRTWVDETNRKKTVDVGSHTEFFYIELEPHEESWPNA